MDYKPKHFELPNDETINIEGISPYVFTEKIAIAVDVALATGRPLLVAGPPGSGKSRLADALAALKDWNFLSHTMTSRTRLEELTGELDHLQRLHDAHAGARNDELKPDWAYRKPGIFWWAYDSESAKNRGGSTDEANELGVSLTYPDSGKERKVANHTVLLLDEIDKAEPDLPNDLLEPLDRRSFGIPNGGYIQAAEELRILTIITTNRERELPPAFLRRCVTLSIDEPGKQRRIRIGRYHYPKAGTRLLDALAQRIDDLAKEKDQFRKPPGTSEFLDAIHACIELKLDVDSDQWNNIWPKIEQAVLIKDIRK